jgi:hypothetical protein
MRAAAVEDDGRHVGLAARAIRDRRDQVYFRPGGQNRRTTQLRSAASRHQFLRDHRRGRTTASQRSRTPSIKSWPHAKGLPRTARPWSSSFRPATAIWRVPTPRSHCRHLLVRAVVAHVAQIAAMPSKWPGVCCPTTEPRVSLKFGSPIEPAGRAGLKLRSHRPVAFRAHHSGMRLRSGMRLMVSDGPSGQETTSCVG